MAEGLVQRLAEVWPRKAGHQHCPFEKVRRAYIEARYSKHYRITKEVLEEAAARLRCCRVS